MKSAISRKKTDQKIMELLLNYTAGIKGAVISFLVYLIFFVFVAFEQNKENHVNTFSRFTPDPMLQYFLTIPTVPMWIVIILLTTTFFYYSPKADKKTKRSLVRYFVNIISAFILFSTFCIIEFLLIPNG